MSHNSLYEFTALHLNAHTHTCARARVRPSLLFLFLFFPLRTPDTWQRCTLELRIGIDCVCRILGDSKQFLGFQLNVIGQGDAVQPNWLIHATTSYASRDDRFSIKFVSELAPPNVGQSRTDDSEVLHDKRCTLHFIGNTWSRSHTCVCFVTASRFVNAYRVISI